MWAVYGLDENLKETEKFLGYVGKDFFYQFSNPNDWDAIVLILPDGMPKAGRVKGRAFFSRVDDISVNPIELDKYMSG